MSNKSHFNKGHISINVQRKKRQRHSSFWGIPRYDVKKTAHVIIINDAIEVLRQIPDSSIQLIVIDPPYNLDLEEWDSYENYIEWASVWLDEISRILTDSGNCIIFGGFQYQDQKRGDLLEILHYVRHSTPLRLVNLIVWYYKNGMSAHRFFANRHEEIVWLAKTKKYYFDLDAVRIPYDDHTKNIYKKDKRLNPATVDKGKNPTNVWEINRLNGNSKERVGHPTQKPAELIRRLVRALSYPGAVVLDFFAGSGTTGRVCIEEGRNSILVDIDPMLMEYFNRHLLQVDKQKVKDYSVLHDIGVEEAIQILTNLNPLQHEDM